jgi:hypothetical protein
MEFKPSAFTKEILIVCLVIIGGLSILFPTLHIWTGLASIVIGAWIYTLVDASVKNYKDMKERWIIAQSTYGGRDIMPDFKSISRTLDFHQWGTDDDNLATYGFVNMKTGYREGFAINQSGVVVDRWNQLTHDLDYPTWLGQTEAKAYHVVEKRELSKAIEMVRAAGYALKWVGKKKVKFNDEEEESD